MELTLKPTTKIQYPVVGVLVKGNSPREWLQHIEALHVDLSQVDAYAIPGQKANELFGCLLITKIDKTQINQHQPIVAASSRLLIPQYSDIFPKLTENEWLSKFSKPCLFLPEIGLFELETPLDWISIFEKPQPKNFVSGDIIDAPPIPSRLKSVQIRIDEDELLKNLETTTGNSADLKNLPFDMKKVMAGNTREIEKYLKYLETNPEFALQHPLPLDVYGTSRNSSDGVFDFSAFSGIFSGITTSKIGLGIITAIATLFVIFLIIGLFSLNWDTTPQPSGTISINFMIVLILVLAILVFLMSKNQLTFGSGTVKRKIVLNVGLLVGLYLLIQPIVKEYDTPVFVQILVLIGALYLVQKVYNINAKILPD